MESSDSKPTRNPVPAKSRRPVKLLRKRATSSPVTIRDVAERSGFSSATVSIVLNNAPLARYIPDTTKARIQRAAAQLGYRPNLFARSLRGRRSHTVGVMVFDMTDPYCTLVLRGIENTLYQSSFLAHPHRRSQRAQPLRALSGNAARSPHRRSGRAGELAVCRYQRARGSREKQHSDRHRWARTQE